MGETPPGDGADRGVLHPGEQQQQTEDGLDIDRHHEEGVDVEIHRTIPPNLLLGACFLLCPQPSRLARAR